MKPSPEKIRLLPISSDLKRSLQPYADLLETVILPCAVWLHGNQVEETALEELTTSVDEFLRERLRIVPHPSITYHALRVCCHYYFRPRGRFSTNRLNSQKALIDSAYRLVCALEQKALPSEYPVWLL